jgi:DNA-binding PadR family transcriptional regulator
MTEAERLQSYMTELRRGSWILVVLGALQKPYYGYALLQVLQEQGIDMEANTLYPLMRRL